jgi:hypothetical protein
VARLQQLPFGGPPIPQHQVPGAPALGQGGQQPILNVSPPFSCRGFDQTPVFPMIAAEESSIRTSSC